MNPPSVLSAQVALHDHVPQSGLRRICRTTRTAQQGIYCIAGRSSHRSQRRLDRKLGISRSKCPEFQEISIVSPRWRHILKAYQGTCISCNELIWIGTHNAQRRQPVEMFLSLKKPRSTKIGEINWNKLNIVPIVTPIVTRLLNHMPPKKLNPLSGSVSSCAG